MCFVRIVLGVDHIYDRLDGCCYSELCVPLLLVKVRNTFCSKSIIRSCASFGFS